MTQIGTKQIDPDTGLIYFKYDFGYEFGIVLPGERKKTVESSKKTIQGQRRASDIEVPIVHEFTEKKANGFAKRNTFPSRQSKPGSKFGCSKTVKWEPTSESEFSEAEDTRSLSKKQSSLDNSMAPPSLIIPSSVSPSRWDRVTLSPLSLSPSLPSLSPRHSSATGPSSNVDSAGITPAIEKACCLHQLFRIFYLALLWTICYLSIYLLSFFLLIQILYMISMYISLLKFYFILIYKLVITSVVI